MTKNNKNKTSKKDTRCAKPAKSVAGGTHIEWADETWNPISGCTKCSPACKNCYAERETIRMITNPRIHTYDLGFDTVVCHDTVLDKPLHWTRNQRKIFVCSMADIFHDEVPFEFIEKIFNVARLMPQHKFLYLTKRSSRLAEIAQHVEWLPNMWVGVSVETVDYIYRIQDLLKVPTPNRFLSVEPLLGPIPNLPLDGIQHIILGGEKCRRRKDVRPMDVDWARDIRDQCIRANVPFMFKQYGGTFHQNKRRGRLLDGVLWDQYPEGLILGS